ncbi:putative disease resistance protein rga4, partial [Quercus suber]
IRNLTSLKRLKISDCLLLGQKGEDWSFIAHVLVIDVDFQNQQEETISSGMHLAYLSFNPKFKINYWVFKESDLESESVCLLPEEELILQQPLQDLDYITDFVLVKSRTKIEGWWTNSDDDDDNEPHHLLLPSFPPYLSTLVINKCPNLTYMPPFPYLKERLELSGCSWKVLEQTMNMKMKMGAATTSTYFHLSQLQELRLEEINDLESLPEEWLRNLGCHNLTSLPQEICNLTSLTYLSISDCPLLRQRCKRQIGENLPFIAHVLIVYVDD